MASQQTLIAETIRGMKLALKRRDDESDSDASIRQHTNRGNKLKRRAHFVRDGRLDTSGGISYKRRIDHAGYSRTIIFQNPAVYDFDGDLVDPDEYFDDEHMFLAEDNPFAETKIEELLRPLTSPAALADHPALSVPYTSKHIDEMVDSATEMLHRERKILWDMKSYLQQFRGDEEWVPLANVETDQDSALLDNDGLGLDSAQENQSVSASIGAADGFVLDTQPTTNGTTASAEAVHESQTNGVQVSDMAAQPAAGNDEAEDNADKMETDSRNGDAANTDDADTPIAHAMTTRAKARTPPPSDSARSPTPSTASLPALSSFFIPSLASLPDQTLGLPEQEADDTRRMLLLYVQKQEEVVRGLERLIFGLQRANRMRNDAWNYSKAWAHVGEMSDGEDWYDMEAWGLDKELIKGKEEEVEEDEGKRRGRRREAKGRNAAVVA